MSLHEEQTLSGRLTIELRTPDGRTVTRRQHDNLITTAGKALVASGAVSVDGAQELRKTCKIRAGQIVSGDGFTIRVVGA